MSIRITASKRDDILKRKAEYEAEYAQRKSRYDAQNRSYEKANDEVCAKIEDAIRNKMGDLLGELNININLRGFGKMVQVEVGNDLGSPRRSDNASLTYSWKATLDKDGQITKESSSWSGLNATTMEQIEDLKICVQQLEILNSIDWYEILNVDVPEYQDYITENNPDWDRDKPNFDRELFEADIEEAIGQRRLLLAKNGVGRYYRGDVYFGIIRDSGSQYTVFEMPKSYVEADPAKLSNGKYTTTSDMIDAEYAGNTYRIKKDTLINSLYRPIQSFDY